MLALFSGSPGPPCTIIAEVNVSICSQGGEPGDKVITTHIYYIAIESFLLLVDLDIFLNTELAAPMSDVFP